MQCLLVALDGQCLEKYCVVTTAQCGFLVAVSLLAIHYQLW